MVGLREQRLSELGDTERLYRQRIAVTEPSRQECERADNEADEKRRDAIMAVEIAQEAGGGEALGEARRCLEASCTKSAASALMAVADVAKSCEKEARCAVKAAERAVRDVVVMRCRPRAEPGDRGAFLEAAEEAFGRPLDRELRAVLLLAYHKVAKGMTRSRRTASWPPRAAGVPSHGASAPQEATRPRAPRPRTAAATRRRGERRRARTPHPGTCRKRCGMR